MSTPLRVAIDGRELTANARYGGLRTYTRELVAALARRPDIAPVVLATADLPLPDGVERLRLQRFLPDRRRATLEHLTRAWVDVARARADVFHNPFPHPVRVLHGHRVQTLHDVIPLVRPDADLATLRRQWERFAPRYRAAEKVIAVSRYSADEGIARLGLDPGRVEVVHHGVGRRFTPVGPRVGADGGDPPYLVVVSEFSMRKGYGEAFGVIAALAEAGLPHRLKVAGKVVPSHQAELDRLVAAADRPDRIDLLGYVDDLPALVRGAQVALVPSRFEGFGLPAVEAMACGVPVVSFDNTSLGEVVADGGVLVADGDVAAMAAAARSILTDPARHDDLAAAALRRATAFDWDTAAAAHAAIYREVAAR